MAFWGIFTTANVDPFMVVGTLLQMFIYNSTSIQQIYNIDVMFGRIIYILEWNHWLIQTEKEAFK